MSYLYVSRSGLRKSLDKIEILEQPLTSPGWGVDRGVGLGYLVVGQNVLE